MEPKPPLPFSEGGARPPARTLSASSSAGSFPIRAPLTPDDDDDDDDDGSDFDPNGRYTVSSGRAGSSYSSGFESGASEEGGFSSSEDGFDKASESERLLVADPDGENAGGSSVSDYRPSVGVANGESSHECSSFSEEETERGGFHSRGLMPRVRLSMDDDELDGVLDSEVEDIGFSGVAKVPGVESVPRIRILTVEESEEDEESLELDKNCHISNQEVISSASGDFSGHQSVVYNSEEELGLQKRTEEITKLNYNSKDKLEEDRAIVDDSSQGDFVAMVKPVKEGSAGMHVIEIEEDTVEGEGKWDHNSTNCSAVSRDTDKLESYGEPDFDMRAQVPMIAISDDSKRFDNLKDRNGDQAGTSFVQDYKNLRHDEMLGEVNVIPSGIDSASDRAEGFQAENEVEQESRTMGEKISRQVLENLISENFVEQTDENMSSITGQESTRLSPAGEEGFHDQMQPIDDFKGSAIGSSTDNLSQDEKERIKMLHLRKLKFLRLVERLGHQNHGFLVTKVLQKLALMSGVCNIINLSGIESDKGTAYQLEAEGKDDLDLTLNIIVLGKTGVGKSSTINTIFGERKALVGAFGPGTSTTEEIFGVVEGLKLRILDTPGLRSSVTEEKANRSILGSIKKRIRKFSPDVVLYIERLDEHTLVDTRLLRLITSTLGSSVWQKAILVLTHASSFPDVPSYDTFISHRSQSLQQAINQVASGLRLMNVSKTIPVALVENSVLFKRSNKGESELPDRESSRIQLLLLCCSLKIFSGADLALGTQGSSYQNLHYVLQLNPPPLPNLLTELPQSRAPSELFIEGLNDVESGLNFRDLSELAEDSYHHLPPFEPLKRAQGVKLVKELQQFTEYEYPAKKMVKQQCREEMEDSGYYGAYDEGIRNRVSDDFPETTLASASIGDGAALRYQSMELESQLLMALAPTPHKWDQDCGVHSACTETNAVTTSINLDSLAAEEHGSRRSTTVGIEVQSHLSSRNTYIFKAETKSKSVKGNKIAAGLSFTPLEKNLASGLKLKDQVATGRWVLAASAGAINYQDSMAYGAKLELRVNGNARRKKQERESRLGVCVVKQRGDKGYMTNLEWQLLFGQGSKRVVELGMRKEQKGGVSLRVRSWDEVGIGLIGFATVAVSIIRKAFGDLKD